MMISKSENKATLAMVITVCLWATVLLMPTLSLASSCPKSPTGYYSPPTPGGPFTSGLPPTNGFSYVKKPAALSCNDLAEAHKLCIARINEYRAGTMKFSNGNADPALGTPSQMQWASGMDKCHSEITMGDFALMGACGNGAHKNAWSCDGFDRSWGQNLCCPRTIDPLNPFQSLLTSMYSCLQAMWDEGIDPNTGTNGHWENMKDPSFHYASCGFAFGTSGSSTYVLMTQNFGGTYSGATSPTGSTPSSNPVTVAPTLPPSSKSPTGVPTLPPSSKSPTGVPTLPPSSKSPTGVPTLPPSSTGVPTLPPSSTGAPTVQPSTAVASTVTKAPTRTPTKFPTRRRAVKRKTRKSRKKGL